MEKNKSVNAATLGLFTALIVVLQLISYLVKIGTFNLSLVLIPIVLASVLFGAKHGAVLGLVFGFVTAAASVAGLDAGGNVLFQASPFATCAVCLIKGAAAGAAAGAVASLFKQRSLYAAVIAAAVTAPIVNTGIFTAAMFLFFRPTLIAWANGQNIAFYAITGLIGINFLIEFSLDVILSPAVLAAVKALKSARK